MTRLFKIRNVAPVLCGAALMAFSFFAVSAQDDTNAPPAANPPQSDPASPDEPAAPAEEPVPTPARPAETPAPVVASPPAPAPVAAPAKPEISSKLRKDCETLRTSAVAAEPIGRRYLELVEAADASAKDFNDFGVFLARRFYLKIAEDFVETATEMDAPTINYWLNLGTVRVQFGKLSSALVAYEKARKIDVNSAQAHYGIGVVHDYMRNYDAAVDSYARALALDPSLGDPKKNPQAANNDRLTVVKLLLYQAGGGGMALPLQGGPSDDPRKPKPPVVANGNGKKI